MKLVIIAIAALFLSASVSLQATNLQLTSLSNNQFGFDLFKLLQKKSIGENTFLSPISIFYALAMTYEGSTGNSAKEFEKVMYLNRNLNQRLNGVLTLSQRLQDIQKNCILKMANAIWPEKSFQLEKSFQDNIAKFYNGLVYPMDYLRNADASRIRINKWIEDIPQGKIKNIIPPRLLNALTRTNLTNAIYFKADWLNKFQNEKTYKNTFYLANNQKTEAYMMNMKSRYNYFESDEFKMLEIPYKQQEIGMYFLLPENMQSFIQNLSTQKFMDAVSKMTRAEVKISIPRFKFETRYELVEFLKGLGLKDAFTGAAKFTNIFKNKQVKIFISNVIHKTFIEVNEQGTEAAAATVVVGKAMCAPPRRALEFIANKPFIFVIMDKGSGTILFAGSMMNPSGLSIAPSVTYTRMFPRYTKWK